LQVEGLIESEITHVGNCALVVVVVLKGLSAEGNDCSEEIIPTVRKKTKK